MKAQVRLFLLFPISWLSILLTLTVIPIDQLFAASLAIGWGLISLAIKSYIHAEWPTSQIQKNRFKTALKDIVAISTIVVVSFQVTVIGAHFRDPIGWNSDGFVLSNVREVYQNQNNDEVVIRTADSSFLMMRLLQKVFVFIHKPSESENYKNLIFSYIPGQVGELYPHIKWTKTGDVDIQLRSFEQNQIEVQKTRLGKIQIRYDI